MTEVVTVEVTVTSSSSVGKGLRHSSGGDLCSDCTQVDLDNKITLHVCSPGYCWGRSRDKAKSCKWGYGDAENVKEYPNLPGMYGSKPCSSVFSLERDCRNRIHPCMPRNHPRRLQAVNDHWRLFGCNMDHQVVLSCV